MRIIICEQASEAKAIAAELLVRQLEAKPVSVLGLATGQTMEGVYEAIVEHHRTGRCSFARARSFNLDEYIGLSSEDPHSYRQYMEERLFRHVDICSDRIHLPTGDALDLNDEADRYERAISRHGPIDVQLLGLGGNGHIGFNEPSSEFDSRTRVVSLSQTTIEANGRFFQPGERQPTHALTMGVATIMQARRIVLLAVGWSKSKAVAGTVDGEVSIYCPSTALQTHRDAIVIVDKAAASDLVMPERYEGHRRYFCTETR